MCVPTRGCCGFAVSLHVQSQNPEPGSSQSRNLPERKQVWKRRHVTTAAAAPGGSPGTARSTSFLGSRGTAEPAAQSPSPRSGSEHQAEITALIILSLWAGWLAGRGRSLLWGWRIHETPGQGSRWWDDSLLPPPATNQLTSQRLGSFLSKVSVIWKLSQIMLDVSHRLIAARNVSEFSWMVYVNSCTNSVSLNFLTLDSFLNDAYRSDVSPLCRYLEQDLNCSLEGPSYISSIQMTSGKTFDGQVR